MKTQLELDLEHNKDSLLPYQKRLVNEKEELEEKIKNLEEFVNSFEFRNIDNVDQMLLKRQMYYMLQYKDVLMERIKFFMNKILINSYTINK